MELTLSPEDSAFRDEVRAFIAENYPVETRVPNPETDLSKEQMLLWHRILHKKGWIAPLWPSDYGGLGWSITRRTITTSLQAFDGLSGGQLWPSSAVPLSVGFGARRFRPAPRTP